MMMMMMMMITMMMMMDDDDDDCAIMLSVRGIHPAVKLVAGEACMADLSQIDEHSPTPARGRRL